MPRCPYCRSPLQSDLLQESLRRDRLSKCPHCHKPIALYTAQADLMTHSDRSIRPLLVEGERRGALLEVVPNAFAPGHTLPIPIGERQILGRHNPDSDADLQIMTSDPSMDRNHAELSFDGTTLTIADHRSRTGTYLNAVLLTPKERRSLADGDVLTLGATTIIIHFP